MNKLSPIAQDFLEDFEILIDAWKQLDDELAVWWEELVYDIIIPDFKEHLPKGSGSCWDNDSNPGHLEMRWNVTLQVLDPRNTSVRDYVLRIYGGASLTKKIRANSKLIDELDEMRRKENLTTLFPSGVLIIEEKIPIKGDDPDATFKAVLQKAHQLYKLIQLIKKLPT